MILKGLKFGMLLQFAIGPMCLMVFNTSTLYGFRHGLYLVFAIAFIDALYIALSCIGVASIINKKKILSVIKPIGCLVLVLFGTNILLSVFDLSCLSRIAWIPNTSSESIFLQGLLLTASNPLTIVFWSGVFSTQIIENKWNKKQLALFGIGCVMATIIFLTVIAMLGSMLSNFLPQIIVKFLNAMVGIILIFLGIRILFRKDKGEALSNTNK